MAWLGSSKGMPKPNLCRQICLKVSFLYIGFLARSREEREEKKDLGVQIQFFNIAAFLFPNAMQCKPKMCS